MSIEKKKAGKLKYFRLYLVVFWSEIQRNLRAGKSTLNLLKTSDQMKYKVAYPVGKIST